MKRLTWGRFSHTCSTIGLLAMLLLIAGCEQTSTTEQPSTQRQAAGQYRDEMFRFAIDGLGRLEEFAPGDVMDRLVMQASPIGSKPDERQALTTLLITWPESAMQRQAADRLSQWIRGEPDDAAWQPDPMIAGLPAALRGLPMMQDLSKLGFSHYDGFALVEAMWLRQVSNWARGEESDSVAQASRLFDWTVRNIALQTTNDAGQPAIPQVPWEAMFLGRGTAAERAWVFVLLCRQQGIDAAVLGLADNDPKKAPELWAVAVMAGGKAYLFDPKLGVPIPAASSPAGEKTGPLSIKPATWDAVLDDPDMLRQLDVDSSHAYPVKAEDLQRVVVMLEASPDYLSRRMELIEKRLAGSQKIVLTNRPSARVAAWNALPKIREVALWTLPYETLQQRLNLPSNQIEQRLRTFLPFSGGAESPGAELYRGRLLQLKGKFGGESSAIDCYQHARPPNQDLQQLVPALAKQYYNRYASQLDRVPPEQRAAAEQQLQAVSNQAAGVEVSVLARVKYDASYWLGVTAFETGNYRSAIDYFARRTLEPQPEGPWRFGGRYNLARSLEASGQWSAAIAQYQQDSNSPGAYGNLLRAKWLKEAESKKE